MSIHPQEIAILLNLCPICEDIQLKILMLVIGMNGTPTSNLFKAPIIFTFFAANKVFNYTSRRSLKPSSYFRDLVMLHNLKFNYWDDDDEDGEDDGEEEAGEEDILHVSYEIDYEINMAYTLTYGDETGNECVDYMQKIKAITKKRLNKMIETEPPSNNNNNNTNNNNE
jgi:hypothetical protein